MKNTINTKLALKLLDEIYFRITVTIGILKKIDKNKINLFVVEGCFLQLRIICEILALYALSMNDRGRISKKLKKEWNAGRIITILFESNPLSFPQKISIGEKNEKFVFIDIKDDGIKSKEVIKIYNKCGEILHRGFLLKIEKENTVVFDIDFLINSINSIGILLQRHMIVIPDSGTTYIGTLHIEGAGAQLVTAVGASFEVDITSPLHPDWTPPIEGR